MLIWLEALTNAFSDLLEAKTHAICRSSPTTDCHLCHVTSFVISTVSELDSYNPLLVFAPKFIHQLSNVNYVKKFETLLNWEILIDCCLFGLRL